MPSLIKKSAGLLMLTLLILILHCCSSVPDPGNPADTIPMNVAETREGICELRPGDIIVKPNLNFLPGTSIVDNGSGFGHAAIVTSYYSHENIDSLLENVTIIESTAKDVPRAFQIREIRAQVKSKLLTFANNSFDSRFKGNRYRLRLNVSEQMIDSVIAFARQQKGDLSSWNAAKRFPGLPFSDSLTALGLRTHWADNNTWYCSLLVWQSFLKCTSIDLDPNGGYMVYPNDLIASPHFDWSDDKDSGRVRF